MAYLVSGIFFVLSLGGLSKQETARRGNVYGIVGMTIAILATFLSAAQVRRLPALPASDSAIGFGDAVRQPAA